MSISMQIASDGDVVVENGRYVFIAGGDERAQHMQSRLRTFLAEWFLNTALGVPYFEQILRKNPNPIIVDSVIKREISESPGFVSLLEYESVLDPANRLLTVDFQSETDEGVVELSEVFG